MIKKLLIGALTGCMITMSVSTVYLHKEVNALKSEKPDLQVQVKEEVMDYLSSDNFTSSKLLSLQPDEIEEIATIASESITPQVQSGKSTIDVNKLMAEVNLAIEEKIAEIPVSDNKSLSDEDISSIKSTLESELKTSFNEEMSKSIDSAVDNITSDVTLDSTTKQELITEITATLKDYINKQNLKGTDGKTPVKGIDYFTAADIASLTSQIQSNILSSGELKVTGADGKSAYQIAVEKGFVGTQEQWLESLKGSDGTNGTNGTNGIDGINGTNGTNGADGKSAYQIAVDKGYVGTEDQWITELNADAIKASVQSAVLVSINSTLQTMEDNYTDSIALINTELGTLDTKVAQIETDLETIGTEIETINTNLSNANKLLYTANVSPNITCPVRN